MMDLELDQRMLIEDDADYMPLPGPEASQQYFGLLRQALPLSIKCLASRDSAPNTETSTPVLEGQFIQETIERFLYTVSALEMKYAFKDNENVENHLHVDLTDSGFPNYVDIDTVGIDLRDRDELLSNTLPEDKLKKLIIERMLREKREPQKLLEALAQRTYLEMLEPEKLFLPFTQGTLRNWHTSASRMRGYVYSWGCYNPVRNCPFVHIMYFDQDFSEVAFQAGEDNLHAFLRVLREEGSHAPERLEDLARIIDERLESVHPKVLKRVRIGPLYSPFLIKARPESKLTDVEKMLLGLLERSASPTDFALLMTEQMVFSEKQLLLSKNLGFKTVAREVFYVPPLEELGDVHRYLLMPHAAFQNITPEEGAVLPYYADRNKFGYDQKENVHAIS
jgi:hypothetical protein